MNEASPGAYHAGDGVRYVTVAGRYIRGVPLLGPGTWAQRAIGQGYKQVRSSCRAREGGGWGKGGGWGEARLRWWV